MENQNKKIFRWIIWGGLVCLLLAIPEMLIAKSISNNNPEVWTQYATTMLLITLFIYLIIFIINIVKYNKYVKNYKQERLEKASTELTTDFKQVLLNYSEPIPKDLFICQAKIDQDGKIVCKIKLDYEVKLENYEKFLRFFHFDQD